MKIEELQKICNDRQVEYDSLPMEPLIVLVEMTAPYSTTKHVRLDGTIALYGLQKAIGDEFYNIDANNPAQRVHAPAPLKRITNEAGQWWYACSFAKMSHHRDQVVSWKKRWDEQYEEYVKFEKKKPRIDHKAGFFKAYSMPMILKNALALWFCCVGNPVEIEELLQNWNFLGKKTAQGYGQIKKITIHPLGQNQHDWSCYDENGNPTRAIPVEVNNVGDFSKLLPKISIIMSTYHPPYWDNSQATWCYAI